MTKDGCNDDLTRPEDSGNTTAQEISRPSGIQMKEKPVPDEFDLVTWAAIHDIRNQISGAFTLVQLTLTDGNNLTIEQRTDLSDSIKAIKSAKRILDQTMTLTRESRRQFALNLQHLDLHTLLRNLIDSLDAKRKFILNIYSNHVQLCCDELHLSRVMANLVENAVKYSPFTEPICINVSEQDGMVHVHIIDRGNGLPEDMTDLFQPFNHGPQRNHGYGIGLSYCKLICQKHGGSIEAANNTDGPGACFTICLPQKSTSKLNER
jgi:signal transduction histidine kinase